MPLLTGFNEFIQKTENIIPKSGLDGGYVSRSNQQMLADTLQRKDENFPLNSYWFKLEDRSNTYSRSRYSWDYYYVPVKGRQGLYGWVAGDRRWERTHLNGLNLVAMQISADYLFKKEGLTPCQL